jgi:hypothetical protein
MLAGVPRCRSQIDAPDAQRHRRDNDQSRSADSRRIQYEGYLRREETHAAILAWRKMPIGGQKPCRFTLGTTLTDSPSVIPTAPGAESDDKHWRSV